LTADSWGSSSFLLSINSVSSALLQLATKGQSQRGTKMLETYFSAPKMIAHLRNGPSGSYMNGFAQSLELSGYRPAIAVRYLRAAAHLGHFVHEQGGTLADIDLSAFREHLRTCRCPRSKGGRRNHHTAFGAKHFRNFLLQIGVHGTKATSDLQSSEPALVVGFQQWLRKHRGAAEPTVQQYARGAASLMMALGDESHWMECDRRAAVFSGTHGAMWQRHY
jgi:hypothetical protein